jgi:GH15 family glucan-1,4-alpha-glucosidase
VSAIQARWRQPDAGIWELDDQRWAHSRLTCAAGLRAMAAAGASSADAAAYSALADAILADTATDCLHPTGRWQRAPGDPRVDAALLLPAIRGALPATDPRSTATYTAVRQDLSEEGYVYRFRQDRRPLGDAEGAFVLATVPPVDRPACSPRNTTSPSARCAATCPKPSSTPWPSKPRPGSPARGLIRQAPHDRHFLG